MSQKNERLKRARLARHWTQDRLAEEVGVSEQTVRGWEGGRRNPSLDTRERLCDIFGMTAEELGLLSEEGQSSDKQNQEQTSQTIVLDELPFNRKEESNRRSANETRLLRRVYTLWIVGILLHSLYRETLIMLGLQEQPDAVANPWRLAVQESNLPARLLPTGTSILDIYDKADGSLLILGEPGSGKTTLLLQLAHTLIKRAEQDESHPIPVIFNLSSWAEKRQPLEAWLTDELHMKYGIPTKLAQLWVSSEKILPLLDGLDEVAEVHISACIDMINTYRKEHGLVPTVVCSRRTDYFAQTARVQLGSAVMVEPLTEEQISEYIKSAGETLAFLRVTLENDPVLLEIATSPLMLNILALIATDPNWNKELLTQGSLNERRTLIFQQYVERVLLHRGAQRYTSKQTKQWLAWLAQQMERQSQTEFYIERMQPHWLPDTSTRQRYYTLMVRLFSGLGNFAAYILFGWLRGANVARGDGIGTGLLGWLGAPAGNGILGWMAPGIGGGIRAGGTVGFIFATVVILVSILVRAATYRIDIEWRQVWKSQARGFLSGLKAGAVIAVLSGVLYAILGHSVLGGLSSGLAYGLLSSLICGLIYGFTPLLPLTHEVSKSRGSRKRTHLLDILTIGLCSWAGFALSNGLMAGFQQAIIQGFILALCTGMLYASNDQLINNLGHGFGLEIQPAERVTWSWQNVKQNFAQDLRHGLIIGVSTMSGVTIVIGLASTLFQGNVLYGVVYGLVHGPIIGLIVGGMSTLTSILNSGWSSNLLDEHQLARPNEGIHRSLRNSFFAALVFGISGGVLSGIISGLAFGFIGQLSGWLILGTGFMIIFGLMFIHLFGSAYGGVAVTAHFLLRALLWRTGSFPWGYIDFLDYAAERILLRKIGGGYMFVHIQLRDYFATLVPLTAEVNSSTGESSLPLEEVCR